MNSIQISHIEIGIIAIIFLLQLYITIRLGFQINRLKTIFHPAAKVVECYIDLNLEIDYTNIERCTYWEPTTPDNVKVGLIILSNKNPIAQSIATTLNKFLIKNQRKHVIGFDLIKDIIAREVDAEYEEIEQRIPTPLYLGLAATMIGIVVGLFSISEFEKLEAVTTNIFSIINAVKYAMIASFTGLIFTTILSTIIYRRARKKLSRDINNQLSIIQAELLPVLVDSEIDNIAALKDSLNNFAITAEPLTRVVDKQEKIIQEYQKIDFTKQLEKTKPIFEQMSNGMEGLESFSKYLSSLGVISKQLQTFSEKTKKIDLVTDGISETIKESNKIQKFISTHFQEIEKMKNLSIKSISKANSDYNEAVESLEINMVKEFGKLNQISISTESDLKDIYAKLVVNLNEAVKEQILKLEKAYNANSVSFEYVDNLRLFPDLIEKITSGNKLIAENLKRLEQSNINLNASLQKKNNEHLNFRAYENDGNHNGMEDRPPKKNLRKIETILKIAAFLVVISFGIRELLVVFNVL